METVIKSKNLALKTQYTLSADREICTQYRDNHTDTPAMNWIVRRITKRGLALFTYSLTGQLTDIHLDRRDWDGIPLPND